MEFNALRPSAFAIAYWMLGRASEAEDVVQEGFLRMHRARADGELIESPRAYLSMVVSRLTLAHLRSARVRQNASVIVLDVADGQIQAVNSIVNPDKLRHLGPVADVKSLLRSTG